MHQTWYTQRRRLAFAMAGFALVSACTDTPSSPSSSGTVGLDGRATGSSRGESTFVSNARKYSDAGHRPSTGRSGSAMLGVLALVARDGSAQVELVAGGWNGWTRGRRMHDGASGGARLRSAQLKVFDPEGNALYTQNHKIGARTATLAANGLVPGGRAQVQGLIEGADFARVGVVTVDAPARLRPDLAVSSVQAEARVNVNAEVSIVGVVRELNGDLGAWADCVLYVDGAESDRAQGIWVDAGGTASCVFSQTFATAGTRQLEVRAENVAPGDYDLTNNTASRPITVVAAASSFFYSAHVDERAFTSTSDYEYTWNTTDGQLSYDYASSDTTSARYQQASVEASMTRAVRFPLTELAARQSTGDEVVHDVRLAEVPADWTTDNGVLAQSCVSRGHDTPELGRAWLYVCAFERRSGGLAGAPTGWTTVKYERYAGDVTYASRGHTRYWDRDLALEDVYSWNYSASDPRGQLVQLGADYLFTVQILESGRWSNLNAVVGLQPVSFSYDSPRECWTWDDPWALTTSCSASSRTETGVWGFATGEPTP